MDKCIGIVKVYKDSGDPLLRDISEYRLTELPEYKSGEKGEKILLFSCYNSKQESCFLPFSTLDYPKNDKRYHDLIYRIRGLLPSGEGEPYPIIHIYLCRLHLHKPRNTKNFCIKVLLSSDQSSPDNVTGLEFRRRA